MKKILVVLMTLLLLVGCAGAPAAPDPTPEPTPEPIGYSDPIFLVVKKESGIESVEELEGKIIGTQAYYGKESTDYVVSVLNESGLTFETLEIGGYASIPDELNANHVDAWIVEEGAHEIINDYRHDYKLDDYKIIAEYQIPYYEEEEIDPSILNNLLTREPFAVMITGIDERVDPSEYKKARNDVNVLMVVNPEMKHVLTVSFPRDSYIKNACTGYSDKLTHFGMKGTECIKDSIGDLLDVDIEYFVQVSFSTFVKMIDSLGGVEVDVPLDFCMDQDSYRNVAQPYCLVEGEQLLYGEWALALARNRKYDGIYNGDYGRIRNQALIINGLMERISEYPFLLLMAEYAWRADTLAYHNFSAELNDLQALFYLANSFAEGYTVDNYFIHNVGDMTESGMSIGRLTESTKEIAKLKIQYAMTGEMDKESKYYEEAMLGYITGGAGDYSDKYIGEEYYLEGYEPEVEETAGSENTDTEKTTE